MKTLSANVAQFAALLHLSWFFISWNTYPSGGWVIFKSVVGDGLVIFNSWNTYPGRPANCEAWTSTRDCASVLSLLAQNSHKCIVLSSSILTNLPCWPIENLS